ncbi:MAG: hypothetical protein JWO94_386 [Verrucomicrobiaceae bacterium]|nr:hypothetical protein [Verrucomicrobiaceae bacterium]
MKPVSSNTPGPGVKVSRLILGGALIIVGTCLLPVLPLTAVGLGCIILGVGIIVAAVIRANRGPRAS